MVTHTKSIEWSELNGITMPMLALKKCEHCGKGKFVLNFHFIHPAGTHHFCSKPCKLAFIQVQAKKDEVMTDD